MPDEVSQIKERLNIVDVISGYLRLQKAGVNYKALCPFHNEKTPSFMVSPSRQVWHCFGCGEGGDIFTFIEKIESIEFNEALKILAERASVELVRQDPRLRSEKDRLYQICEKAAQFYSFQLKENPSSAKIFDYLKKRGLEGKTVEEWRMGYAPDSWDSLLNFLAKKGFKDFEVEKAGLILKGPRYHDRFRNRLMFPIFDINGRIVAFSGRILSDVIPSKTEKPDTGKYINSPETVLYNKSRILYGLDRAKNDIRKADKAVIAEGQMDVILPWQDGVRNIIATSGTALTEDQLSIIKRLTANLIMAFDMDDAGFRATKRGIDLAQEMGFNVSVLRFSLGKDPADFVKDNPGEFVKIAEHAEPIMSYYFNEVFKKFDSNQLEGKKFIALTLLSEIKRLPSAIERSSWIRELGLKLGVSEPDLKEEMDRIEINAADKGEKPLAMEAAASKTRKEILSERLLALLLKKPEMTAEAAKIAAFLPRREFEVLSAFSADNSFSNIRSTLAPELRPYLDFLCLASDYELEKLGRDFNLESEISFLIKEIEREHYRELLEKISNKIKKQENLNAVQNEEGVELKKLAEEFQSISNKLHLLKNNEKTEKI